jgi:beta-mannanase
LGKIKGLLETNKEMNDNVKSQQAKQQKQLEMMQRIEDRARELEKNNAEWARKSDMMANEANRFRE